MVVVVVIAASSSLRCQCEVTETQKTSAGDVASGDQFGRCLSIQGDLAAVGSFNDDDAGTSSGSAYLFRFDGTSWTEEQKVAPADGIAFGFFGASVAVDGTRALIGAFGDDDSGAESGSAYFYQYNGTSWLLEQKVSASDGAAVDRFGSAVILKGNLAVMGAPLDDDACVADPNCDSGSAYLFRFDGTSWIEEQKITASDGTVHDTYGTAVALDGDVAVIGAPEEFVKGSLEAGAVYIYRFDGTTWNEEQKLKASDFLPDDRFGNSVAICGNTLLVGADGHDLGAGAAYFFDYDGTSWSESLKLTGGQSNFGRSVSLQNGVALIGAPADPHAGSLSGAATVYRLQGSTWQATQRLEASDAAGFDLFGISSVFDGETALVGAFTDDVGVNSGSSYAFTIADLALTVTPNPAMAFDTITFHTTGGGASNPTLLFLTAVNSSPFFNKLANGAFSTTGVWDLVGVVPNDPALIGNDLSFQTFVLDCFGFISATNVDTVTFQ
jgi:hypothetical protein